MAADHDRALRIAAQVKRELAVLLRDKLRDPRVGDAFISGVEVSRDLSCAKVYLLFPHGVDEAETLTALEHAAGFLRVALSRRLRLRGAPRLRFLADDAQRRGDRIAQLLAEEKLR